VVAVDPDVQRVVDQLYDNMRELERHDDRLRRIRISEEAVAGEVSIVPLPLGGEEWLMHPDDWGRIVVGLLGEAADGYREGTLFGVPIVNETGS
jgi:hypothetical protein